MIFENTTISFIGIGAMGEAMLKGILQKRLLPPSQIIVADRDAIRGELIASRYGVEYVDDNIDAARRSNILVLAIKPQVLPSVLPELRGNLDEVTFVLSIIAGAKIQTIAKDLGEQAIVRSMPNTPAQIGLGMTVWTATDVVTDEEREQASAILSALGEQIYVDDEKYIDIATAVNGSGPAYIFLITEALIDVSVQLGFSRAIAEKIVMQTMLGSVQYAHSSEMHIAELRNQVTSPGGTTAAGLYELENGKIRATLANAVIAAYQRSVELGQRD